jgi:hypothetical protein
MAFHMVNHAEDVFECFLDAAGSLSFDLSLPINDELSSELPLYSVASYLIPEISIRTKPP